MKHFRRSGITFFVLLMLSSLVFAHGDISEYDDYTYINEETGTMVRIWVEDGIRYFESNVLPDHETGEFPNSGNPHEISVQNLMLQTTANPELADEITEVGLGKFGLSINGIPFEREAAEWYNRDSSSGWQYDAFGGGIELGFDMNNAHVQPTGLYHYHGIPDVLVEDDSLIHHPDLIGFAADGFPIYIMFGYENAEDASSTIIELQPSYQLREGTRPSGPGGAYDGTFNEDWEYIEGLGDLDQCNGRTGITPEFPEGTYYYVLTQAFPRIPACWSGTPDDGWLPRGGDTQGAGSGQPGGSSGGGQNPPPTQSGGGGGQNPPPTPQGGGNGGGQNPPPTPQGGGGGN